MSNISASVDQVRQCHKGAIELIDRLSCISSTTDEYLKGAGRIRRVVIAGEILAGKYSATLTQLQGYLELFNRAGDGGLFSIWNQKYPSAHAAACDLMQSLSIFVRVRDRVSNPAIHLFDRGGRIDGAEICGTNSAAVEDILYGLATEGNWDKNNDVLLTQFRERSESNEMFWAEFNRFNPCFINQKITLPIDGTLKPQMEREFARAIALDQHTSSPSNLAANVVNETGQIGPTHSEDFTSVNWYGKPFNFTPNQAAAIKILWAEWERDPQNGGIMEKTIAEKIDVNVDNFRLAHTFRGNAALEEMIVATSRRGQFRLKIL